MATVKFLNAAGKFDDPASRDDVIRYNTQKVKTPSGYIGACGVDISYAVHEDTYHTHFHFVFNPVSIVDGHKYSGTKEEHKALKERIAMCVKAI